jgi:cytochrome c oxidase subunit 2
MFEYQSPLPFMPPNLAEHGTQMDSLLFWIHVLMAALFFGWGAFFLFTLVRFRRGASSRANYTGVTSHTSSWLEASVAVIECVLLFGLSIPAWGRWISTDEEKEAEGAVHLRVIAQQFAWNVQYPGPDGKLGPLRRENIDDTLGQFIGLDAASTDGADDFEMQNQLIVPKDRPVRISITSKDVIHSFFLPVMRVKQDAIPGEMVAVAFTPKLTSREYKDDASQKDPAKFPKPQAVKDFEIACAQLCGGQHYRMFGYFHIVSDQEWSLMQTQTGMLDWYRAHQAWKSQ